MRFNGDGLIDIDIYDIRMLDYQVTFSMVYYSNYSSYCGWKRENVGLSSDS